MNTHEIIYLSIFSFFILVASIGSGMFIRYVWFKVKTFTERVQRWRRNGGKF